VAYCPECLVEYREGAAECIDCHVPLRSGPPPAVETSEFAPDVKLVTVRTFDGATASMNAELAQNVLKEEGILSALQGGTAARLLGSPAFLIVPESFGVFAVHLQVREENAARADETLKAFESAAVEIPEDEPERG
jgi:hypothetical protein